eukprot:CAMPEP_0172626718 /NCGR_PEP_ID=MMETSP1068-20121228/152114_1 /TAXON_ID=35684 /ORGANISM="Pseudopedinella elastica, Strain CCMP716" /LENGTH=67 /DNA_ID=CAMNT_0013436425 /DNA_START=76 /DNA_END=276 /DNA_ORIENTATION=-
MASACWGNITAMYSLECALNLAFVLSFTPSDHLYALRNKGSSAGPQDACVASIALLRNKGGVFRLLN